MRPLGAALRPRADATAEAVIEVATANMYAAFSNVLARHGLDPRDFALVAFGGAGPIEACFLAEEFHIPRVIVPPSPGTLCAQGAMMADVKSDYVKTIHRKLSATPGKLLAAECAELSARATRGRRRPRVSASSIAQARPSSSGQASRSRCRSTLSGSIRLAPDRLRPLPRRHSAVRDADPRRRCRAVDLRATITVATPNPTQGGPTEAVRHAGGRRRSNRNTLRRRVYHRRDLMAGQRPRAAVSSKKTRRPGAAGFRLRRLVRNLVIEVPYMTIDRVTLESANTTSCGGDKARIQERHRLHDLREETSDFSTRARLECGGEYVAYP